MHCIIEASKSLQLSVQSFDCYVRYYFGYVAMWTSYKFVVCLQYVAVDNTCLLFLYEDSYALSLNNGVVDFIRCYIYTCDVIFTFYDGCFICTQVPQVIKNPCCNTPEMISFTTVYLVDEFLPQNKLDAVSLIGYDLLSIS